MNRHTSVSAPPDVHEHALLSHEVADLLTTSGIDLSLWGRGVAKTLEHLLGELEVGETTLVADEHGQLLRRVQVAVGDIYYDAPDGTRYRLREDRQVYHNGSEKRRFPRFAVAEKIQANETPMEGMRRGICEELGICSDDGMRIEAQRITDRRTASLSYPGLLSHQILHEFVAYLSSPQFKKDGYCEHEADRDIYFVWEKVS